MKYVWMLLTGLIVGLLAAWLYPGNQNINWIVAALLGIAGSYVGGMIGGMFTREKDMFEPKPAGIFLSIIGTLVLIYVGRQLGIL